MLEGAGAQASRHAGEHEQPGGGVEQPGQVRGGGGNIQTDAGDMREGDGA